VKLMLENWRLYEHAVTAEQEFKRHQEELREILRTHGWDEQLIVEFSSFGSAVSGAWGTIKTKLQQAKDWTYDKYLSAIKPLIQKIKEIITWAGQKGYVDQGTARKEEHAFDLLSTKKYIKLGYAFISALAGLVLNNITEIPEKVKVITDFIKNASRGSIEDLCTLLGLPCDELKQLTGSLKSFGPDMDRTYGAKAGELDLRHPSSAPEGGWGTLGQGEFEFAQE